MLAEPHHIENMKARFLFAGLVVCACVAAPAATPLTESTFTEIIKEAKVVAASTKTATPARTNEVFRAPDLVRTGPDSRVEMTAPDQTITRIGANTVFTFEPGERIIRLQTGSILFHSPAGAGGGTVKYHGTAAAVLGTTMICAVLPDGSFKILVLEGHAKVTLMNGKSITLNAGEMIIVQPDGLDFGDVMVVNLGELVARLQLVMGFSHELSSMSLIAAAIQLQNEQIAAGTLDHFVSFWMAANGLDLIGGNGELDFPPPLNTHDFTTIPLSPFQP
jgi:hypothetical protein